MIPAYALSARPPAVESFRFASTSITPPLGLAYIAGALEAAGIGFSLLDCVALAPEIHRKYLRGYLVGLPYEDLVRMIPAGVRIIGISAVFTHEWPYTARLIALIRQAHPHAIIIVGGLYSSQLSVPVLATRGCPYQCTHCSAPNMWSPNWIARDPVKMVDEIEYYMQAFGARNFPFQDLTAIVKKDWIVKFCEEIITRKLDITWQMPSGTRSEAIDPQVAVLLKQSGMVNMSYAPESGSEQTRQLVKKKMHTDKLIASIKASSVANLNVAIFLVLGFPHDTRESLEENLAFIDRIAELQIQDIAIGYYMALPGTELFQALYRNGKITIGPAYFAHILSAASIIPEVSFCDMLTRWQLAYWKFRLFLRFYRHPSRTGRSGTLGMAAQVLKGMFDLDHETKLQSAMRNGMRSLFYSLAAYARPRWLARKVEKHFFDGWDEAFRSIDAQGQQAGLWKHISTDYKQLQATNIIAPLKLVHAMERSVTLQTVA